MFLNFKSDKALAMAIVIVGQDNLRTYSFSILPTRFSFGHRRENVSKSLSNLSSGRGTPRECFIISIINRNLLRSKLDANNLQHPDFASYSVNHLTFSFVFTYSIFAYLLVPLWRSNVQMSLVLISHGLFKCF